MIRKQGITTIGMAGALALGMALVLPGAVNAAPKTVSEIASYKGGDRQAVLEKGAKKEGTLMVYTTGTQTKPIMDAFRKKYPFLNVKVFRGGTTMVVRRITEELRAGKNFFDVLDQNVASARILHGMGELQAFYTPEAKNFVKPAIGPGGHWILTYQ